MVVAILVTMLYWMWRTRGGVELALGLTTTVATESAGPNTVTLAEALIPSPVAVSETTPEPTAVTRPVAVTVAFDASAVAHTIARPVSTLPLASNAVAIN